ncbi:CGNR zinc finger domain-containing protein [Mycolicibacterium sp.]|uniref:CGNR zinc finger domain-containing protein n=1 Tax=Mycolicibacterium sp. TaxID=2320850 RepID=UPI003D09E461
MAGSLRGMPLLGERVSLELANTLFMVRGRPTEGLTRPQQLADWLRLMGFVLDDDEVTDDDVARAHRLRDAIRTIAGALVCEDGAGGGADADPVAVLNEHAGTPARWHELALTPQPHVVVRSAGRPVDAALGAIAADAVDLFGGPDRAQLRICGSPSCILYFVGNGRREWCSNRCGNRARAARHYAKTKQS